MNAQSVLIVTGLHDTTADWVIEELCDRRVPVVRLDPADIGEQLVLEAHIGGASSTWQGRVSTPSRTAELADVRSLYYRRPSPYADAYTYLDPPDALFAENEARYGLGGVLSALPNCLYVNHSVCITRAEMKPEQLRTAARVGFPVPATLITNDLGAAQAFAAKHRAVVYKPLRSPRLHAGQARTIWAQEIDARTLDESIVAMPHLLQARVDKVADLRVTVIGDRAFGVRIECDVLDWRSVDQERVRYTRSALPEALVRRMHAYLRAFGLVFGCFDFALTESCAVFLECNPNGQWAWLPGADEMASALADVLVRGL